MAIAESTASPNSSFEQSSLASTRTSLYETSTQHRQWRYSPQGLASLRSSLNDAAVHAIRNAFEADDPGSSESMSFLTPEDEYQLVKLYIGKVGQLCGHFRMPEIVEATTCSYIKRFYLKNTVMDWHPKNVMLTAMFLATKTTNNPIALDTYAGHIPKTTPSDVLDLEFLVAQSLRFQFAVWHAHKALWGIYLDLQSLPSPPIPFETIHSAYISAIPSIRASRLTDLEFLYTPSQIAFACLHARAPDLAERWLHAKGVASVSDGSQPDFSALDVVHEINEIIQRDGVQPDLERVREIDKRLKICKNPEKVVGSRAYLKKQVDEAAKAEEKRLKKAVEAKEAEDGRDPFGGDLVEQHFAPTPHGGLDDDDDD